MRLEGKTKTMTEFVLWVKENDSNSSFEDDMRGVVKYAELLSQPLELGMFVPCVEGQHVGEPVCTSATCNSESQNFCDCFDYNAEEYEKALEEVLFKDFKITGEGLEKWSIGCVADWNQYSREFNFLHNTIDELIFHDEFELDWNNIEL